MTSRPADSILSILKLFETRCGDVVSAPIVLESHALTQYLSIGATTREGDLPPGSTDSKPAR